MRARCVARCAAARMASTCFVSLRGESFEPDGAESSSMARADRRAMPSDSTDPAAAQAAEIRKRLRYVEELLDGKPAAVEGE